MRKFFASAAFAAICFSSVFTGCQKEVVTESVSEERATLRIAVQHPETKVVTGMEESSIKNYQVFLFKESGIIEDYVCQASSDITLDCTVGKKMVVVIANAPAMGDVMDIETLNTKTTLLSDNAVDAFVMEGRKEVTIYSPEAIDVSISVTRKVAKVQLTSLTVAIDMPQYSSMPFKVQSVFLINVPAEMTYFETIESPLWYNKSGYDPEDFNDLTYDDMEGFEITDETPYVAQNVFYCYPNKVATDSYDATWCPRNTRLVVEATLGDETYYYPVKLPKLEQNRRYDVKLTVTRPGNLTPDSEFKKFDANFQISVVDWSHGSSISKEY